MDTDDGFRSGAAAPGGRQAGTPDRPRYGSEPISARGRWGRRSAGARWNVNVPPLTSGPAARPTWPTLRQDHSSKCLVFLGQWWKETYSWGVGECDSEDCCEGVFEDVGEAATVGVQDATGPQVGDGALYLVADLDDGSVPFLAGLGQWPS